MMIITKKQKIKKKIKNKALEIKETETEINLIKIE